ncbi:MAG TPA: alginate lyase family protein [Tepidisphaeraceae bacterium]|jgi:hypothetical protein
MKHPVPAAVRSAAVEVLENRLLYAQTPALRAATLGRSFDLGERQVLLARLNNLPKSTYTTLAGNLQAGSVGAFDGNLLAYMRTRSGAGGAKWFFQPADAPGLAAYVSDNSSPGFQIENATDITDRRLFPEQSAVDSYTIQMAPDINWSDSSKSSSPEWLPALNRMDWFPDLAQSFRYTGDSKFIEEMKYELADWSYANPTFRVPTSGRTPTSYAFDISIRVENWLHGYFSVLGSNEWGGADNSLMLYKLIQQGDILSRVGGSLKDFLSNRSVSIGRAEMFLGLVLPEVDNAAAWEAGGRSVLYKAIDTQFYSDGSHREQSPGYAVLTIDQLMEARRLDGINGNAWTSARQTVLTNAVDSLWQQLSPDGNRPAIGDTYRVGATTVFLKAAVTLGQSRWPEAKPRPRDIWVLGSTAVDPYKTNPVTPPLGTRGGSDSFPVSGNYVVRSGSDASARQINFDAGPKGGGHGHSDLLAFEFFGYGRPLISDPGLYQYESSAKRNWVVSTKAHSTIGVADLNHGDLESNAGIVTTGFKSVASGTMITAGHQGYFFTPGAPTVSRSMWFDGDDTMVVVDFVEATRAANFEQGFLVQNQNTSRNLAAGLVYTRNAAGGNVRIQSLLRPGQTNGVQTSNIFTSNRPSTNQEPASRYYVQQLGVTYAVFATLITAHDGSAAGATASAAWVTTPTKPGQSAVLSVNGQNITFSPPAFDRLNARAESRGTFNDIAYDTAGRLHQVYFDRDDLNLKYAVRDTNGVWSTVETIDPSPYAGYNPSLAIDKNNRPGVAYQDAANGDLRYAYLSPLTNAWDVQVVDVKGSTGAYPSLVFNRNNSPSIAYYNKTNGDLRLAQADTKAWLIQTLDSKGDVGRFPSLQLDPNRPTASKFAVAYEDTTNGSFRYAIQSGSGYKYQVVDDATAIAGGYISMKFYDSGDGFKPVMSYYDAGRGQLKYAYDTGNGDFVTSVIAAKKRQGLYSKLDIDSSNRPRVFFFDGTNNRAYVLNGTKVAGGRWTLGDLGAGGREIHFATRAGKYVFSTLDESTGKLSVLTA